MVPTTRALAQLGPIGLQRCRGQHDMAVVVLHDGVFHLGADDQHQIGREGPRRGGPGQHAHRPRIAWLGHQVEGHGDGRVLAGAGGVVQADLEVGQRGLRGPGVGHHPVGLIDETLVPQRLERPHDRLHVGQVHGFVVVVEVHPSGLAGHRGLPVLGVALHRLAAVVVEAVDAVAGDARPSRNRQLLLGPPSLRAGHGSPIRSGVPLGGHAWCGSGG